MRLVGYSFGACVAFEMSIQLQQAGREVGRLILLDGSHSYVAAHTGKYSAKIATEGSNFENKSLAEALCAFMMQFMEVDFNKVRISL